MPPPSTPASAKHSAKTPTSSSSSAKCARTAKPSKPPSQCRRHRPHRLCNPPHHHRRPNPPAPHRLLPRRRTPPHPPRPRRQPRGRHLPSASPKTADGHSRVPVNEVMRTTPPIRKMLASGDVLAIPKVIAGKEVGMRLFDQHLVELLRANIIPGKEAARLANNPEAVLLARKGIESADLAGGIGG